MFVDSHCHLDRVDLAPFNGDFNAMIQSATDSGVDHFLCVSIDLENWQDMVSLVSSYPQISVSVGVHPSESSRPATVGDLLTRAETPGVVAIGETGLDYFYGKDNIPEQQQSLRTHICAARECKKPLIIHTRDAREDTIKILREERADEIGGVLHCFTEDQNMADQAIELGFYISFSGIVTFRNAASLREVARSVPEDRILVETDSPYLAPMPMRGKGNQPAWVRHVAECVAAERGVSLEHLAEVSSENFYRLFKHAKRT